MTSGQKVTVQELLEKKEKFLKEKDTLTSLVTAARSDLTMINDKVKTVYFMYNFLSLNNKETKLVVNKKYYYNRKLILRQSWQRKNHQKKKHRKNQKKLNKNLMIKKLYIKQQLMRRRG